MTVLGYEWLRQQLALSAFEVEQPARVRPVTRVMPAPGLLAVPAQVAPLPGDVLAHVLFALKHEGTNLQVLAQAMPYVPVDALQAALRQTPNGRYVRVLAYLWEAFMGQRLADQPEVAGRYVDVFDPAHYVTGPAQRDARWRVNFNGLGNLRYCATVRRTPAIAQGIAANWLERTAAFLAGLGPAVLDRALAWAYLHETEDSYAIEHEKPTQDKARAFVQLLKMAHEGRPLTEDYLAELQSSTVSHPLDKAAEFRTQQNWLRGPGRGPAGAHGQHPGHTGAQCAVPDAGALGPRPCRCDPHLGSRQRGAAVRQKGLCPRCRQQKAHRPCSECWGARLSA